jgi:CheY-like chemotaxis protein/HPt (histidine-containing phosphotransfer) domain-containing protein
LVVDDNQTNLMILNEMLSNWGMLPTLAESGDLALKELRRGKQCAEAFQLVITDVNMPEMSGFDFVDNLRADEELSGTQVIALTSGGRDGDNLIMDRLQILERLMKPVKQSELFDAVVRLLGVTAPEDATTYPEQELGPPQACLRVLLAEDNVINQRLAVGVLSKYGHHVTVVNNGQEAVNALEKADFDVVLMDVQMPVMDGYEATQQIRLAEQASGRHIPIIAMTAHAMKGDREKCIAAGMDEYIPKPIRITVLREKLALVHESGPSLGLSQRTTQYHEQSPNDATHEIETATANPSGSTESFEAIDWVRARITVGGDEKLLRELLDVYQGEATGLMLDIDRALREDDRQTLKRAAHTLKGASLSVGAVETAKAAQHFEFMEEQANPDDAREAFQNLQCVVERARECARQFLVG